MPSTNRAGLVSTLKDETFLADFYPAFLSIPRRMQEINGPQRHLRRETLVEWCLWQEIRRFKAEITVLEQKLRQERLSVFPVERSDRGDTIVLPESCSGGRHVVKASLRQAALMRDTCRNSFALSS